MEQLVEYLKRINGSIKYPENVDIDESDNNDDDEEDNTDNKIGYLDEEVKVVAENRFTVNFDLLLKKKRRTPRRQIPPWWSEQCEQALLARKRARKTLKKMGDENREKNLLDVKTANWDFKKTVKAAKSAYYKKVEKEIEMHESIVF
ncbi:uncharacterized protein LOC106640914 [Copidosoma floridanum]|uniref:uncharacterized protein LOC106640914 n=1 Tax=Copidosoma floridanum TaxID=29053 RepID=UPI0006C9AE83|nr:uncharacterized protein LOC106640914 [Copidosoma floridanum]XP_014210583.1 uncharacterized protein LOC106640914 [Copidosoma floridanum]